MQVKSGNEKAKQKLLKSQCGFAGPLPKVCCGRKTENAANKIIVKKKFSKGEQIRGSLPLITETRNKIVTTPTVTQITTKMISIRPRYFISLVIEQSDLEESRDGKLKIKILKNKNGSIKSLKNMHNY